MRSILFVSSSVLAVASFVACGGSSNSNPTGNSGGATSSTGVTSTSNTGGSSTTSTGGSTTGPGGSTSSTGGGGAGGSGPATFECPSGVALTDVSDPVAAGDETWTADKTYHVIGPHSTGPHTLTIEAGTVVCFTYGGMPPVDGSLRVAEGGTLNINGTPDKHVVMTRTLEFGPTDAWGGIDYDSNVMKPGTVQNVDFYFAGDSSEPGVINTFGDTKLPPLDYRNVTFRMHQRNGIHNGTSGWTPESNLRFASYDPSLAAAGYYNDYSVLYMHPYGLKTLTATTVTVDPSIPAEVKYVQLDHPAGETIDKDVTMHKLAAGLTYYLLDTTIEGPAAAPNTWTIEAGSTLAIDATSEFRIGTGGDFVESNLVAVGTAAEPILFTSAAVHHGAQPAPGDWNGIMFNPGDFNPMKSKLDFVTLEYGGGASPQGDVYNCNDSADGYAEVEFGLSGVNQTGPGPSITNSTFQKSAGQAIRVDTTNGPAAITTDYTQAALKNTFVGFSDPPAVFPATCP